MLKEADYNLIERTKQGDNCAFEELVRRYEQSVTNIIYYFIQNAHEIDDVFQEVFIRVYRFIKSFRGDCQFSTWLYRITANVCKDKLSKNNSKKTQNIEDIPETNFIQSTTPEELTEKKELYLEIKQLISSLPEDFRIALVLREYEGLSYEEIAQTLDCSIGTVKSRIFRAREILKKQLSNFLEERCN